MSQNPTKRGYLDAFVDKLVGWQGGLTPERTSYTQHEVQIPLEGEEHIKLAATVYQPIPSAKSLIEGTILVQCPYGRRPPLSLFLSRVWAARGYHVLVVSTRGTFDSGGVVDPGRTDRADGPRVVRWMRKQTWYTGSFATWGMSYLGFVQWALMASDEPLDDMAAAIVSVGPHDFSELLWGTGAHWLPSVDWADLMRRQKSLSWWRAAYEMGMADPDKNNALKRKVPLDDAVKDFVGGSESPQYRFLHQWIANEDVDKDPTGFWEPMKQHKALGRADIPILLLAGWQDVFVKQNFDQFEQLKSNGCDVALTAGPWNHGDVNTGEGVMQEVLDWLDNYLAKRPGDKKRQAPVRIKITGSNEWRWLPSWPPATKPLELYLDSPRKLCKSPSERVDHAQFTFDPHDPTPTMGGGLLSGGGYVDDSPLARRADVLSFDLAVDEDVEVIGRPRVELLHSSDNPHVDVFVRLSEVNAKGASRNLCEVYKRLDPSRAQPGQTVTVQLELSPVAHRFKKGTKLRLLVAGGNFPHYSYNLGSGEPQASGTTLRPATHIIQTGGEGGSKFVLPVSLT